MTLTADPSSIVAIRDRYSKPSRPAQLQCHDAGDDASGSPRHGVSSLAAAADDSLRHRRRHWQQPVPHLSHIPAYVASRVLHGGDGTG